MDFAATFVVALYNFAKATIVVGLEVFVDYYCLAAQVLALNSAEVASDLVGFHLTALQFDGAPFFEKRFSFVWAFYNF